MGKIAAIGGRDSILGFKTIGISAYPVENAEKVPMLMAKLAKEGYSVIFITEDIAKQVPEAVDAYNASAYPSVVLIPSAKGSTGEGMARIKRNVEKALGTDIIFTDK